MQVIKYTDIKATSVKIALAGEGGAGKTFWAIAHKLKTLFICTEPEHAKVAIKTAVDMGARSPDNLDVLTCTNSTELNEAIDYAVAHQAEYGLVVLDNFSGVKEIMEPVVNDLVEKKRKASKSGAVDTFAYFGFMGKAITPIVYKLRDLSCDVVAILHTKEQKDANGSVTGVRLDIVGNVIKNAIRRSFSIRGYMEKEMIGTKNGPQINRTISFERGGTFLDFITGHPALKIKEDSNLETILNKIKGQK